MAASDRIGTLIQGEYRIDGVLGQEELGTLYQVHNTHLECDFTVLLLDLRGDPALKTRASPKTRAALRRDLLRARERPGTDFVPIAEVFTEDGVPGYATEVLPGESLRLRLLAGALPVEQALHLAVSLGQGLADAHRHGLVHGDLRPENVFLVDPRSRGRYSQYRGRALLLRHSLYRLRRPPDVDTPVDRLVYRPPEQIAGEVEGPDVRGDIFVLGALLHECLTGHPAFFSDNEYIVLKKLHDGPSLLPEDPAIGLTTELAQALNVLIAHACARDPQVRVPTMADLVRALLEVARGARYGWAERAQTLRRTGMIERLTSRFFLRGPARPAMLQPPAPGPAPAPPQVPPVTGGVAAAGPPVAGTAPGPALAPPAERPPRPTGGVTAEWKALLEKLEVELAPARTLPEGPAAGPQSAGPATAPDAPALPAAAPQPPRRDPRATRSWAPPIYTDRAGLAGLPTLQPGDRPGPPPLAGAPTVRLSGPLRPTAPLRPYDAAQMVRKVMAKEIDVTEALRVIPQGRAVHSLRRFLVLHHRELVAALLGALLTLAILLLRTAFQR